MCAETPYYQSNGLRLDFGWCDFIQINSLLNQLMVGLALEWQAIQPNVRVLDLFCGLGLFTLPLARRAAAVAGIEGVATPGANGQYNAHKNRLSHASFLSSCACVNVGTVFAYGAY
ncbi:MAG: hypothetical protein ACTH5V_19405 [Serratia proteamaculans]